MEQNVFDIFISYKRKSLPTANNLYYRLTTRGYSTFFDLEEMRRDNFDTQLLYYIENAKDVLVILEEGSLDACKSNNWEEDWFCREIAFALEKGKNIIPILLNGYKMPNKDFFPDKLKELNLKQSPEFSFVFFEEYLDKLKEKNYLLSQSNLKDKTTSVFKFYSDKNCQVFKEGKLVCSLEGNSDEPYYLPVPRKGDYCFKTVDTTTKESKIIDEKIDVNEEKSVRIIWNASSQIVEIFNKYGKQTLGIGKMKVFLGIILILSIVGSVVFSFWTKGGNKISDSLSDQVLINARLLDTVFIQTDSVISKAIDYNAYMGIEQNELGDIELGPFYDSFHYIDTCIDGKYAIRPYGEYVGDYYLRDSIGIQDLGFLMLGEDGYTNLHYPVLDVSIVNNSPNTILVNELLIEVEESYTDPNPFVIFYESGGELLIVDRGWKTWSNACLCFSLLPEGQTFDGNYKFEIPISNSSEDGIIPMYDYLVQSGIDFDNISKSSLVGTHTVGEIPYWSGYTDNMAAIDSLQKLLSPIKLEIMRTSKYENDNGEEETWISYKDPCLVLHGELTFDNDSTFKVGGTVRFLTSEGYGAPYLECSRVFDIKLRDSGKNYVIKYPVSHSLKSGDVDRIVIQIDADKTSYHTFKVRLHNVNQIDVETEPIDLMIFKYVMGEEQ